MTTYMYMYVYTVYSNENVLLPALLYVHSSLEPLFENSRLDDELRQLIKKTFPEFCRQGTTYMYMSISA
jgi:hypothetical protein